MIFMVGIKPWKNDSNHRTLNGNKIMLQNNEDIEQYIDIPEMIKNLINTKQYYQNGLRLKTKMNIYKFTKRWGKYQVS